MNITVRIGRKAFRKLVAQDGAEIAFRNFRHNLTDYDHKWQTDLRLNKGRNYAAIADAVAVAALELAEDMPGMLAAVGAYLAAKAPH